MYDTESYGGKGGGFVWCAGGREKDQKWRRTFTHSKVSGMQGSIGAGVDCKGVSVGVVWGVSPILLAVGKRVLAGSERWS